MIRRLPAVWLVAALLLAACGATDDAGDVSDQPSATTAPPTTQAPSSPTPTADGEDEDEGALDDGELDGEALQPGADLSSPATGELGLAEVEGGCAYLEVDGERYELIADPDSDLVIDAGNAVVADSSGEVIAEPGDTITVEGDVDPGIATFCQIGPVLVVSEVSVE